jgi:hypothetical protein
MLTKEFVKCAGYRAVRTICQTASAMIATSVYMHEVNWSAVISASLLAGIFSVLTSIATGLPEIEDEEE